MAKSCVSIIKKTTGRSENTAEYACKKLGQKKGKKLGKKKGKKK